MFKNIWLTLHRLGSPKQFFLFTTYLLPLFSIGAVILLLYGLVGGLYLAPPDYQQGEGFRIIYVHVPSAFLSIFIYVVMGVQSVVFLIWRIKISDILAEVSAPLGASFTLLALVTGALWGKPMWGTWWVWDARLTSELILLFLYLGYIGLRNAIVDPATASKVSALLAIVGLVDIPIVHYSVTWWQTLHQGSTVLQLKPSMPLDMLYPLLAMIGGFICFYMTIVILNARAALLLREQKSRWVKRLIQGKMCAV